jgi:chromosome segregation ATPase
MKSSVPDHEKLFDEICSKLNELSQKTEPEGESWADKIEKMHSQLKRSQDELRNAQEDLHDKLRSMDQLGDSKDDLNLELKRVSDQLEAERISSSKLSTDLAKSLELNLRLQFEIEEIRARASQTLNEERKHNAYLIEKNKSLQHEVELSQALAVEAKGELAKAKEAFQAQLEHFQSDRESWIKSIKDFERLCQEQSDKLRQLTELLAKKDSELQQMTDAIMDFESHSAQQSDALKSLSAVAEKKMVELKVTLDKKSAECQDYYSHLQQALTQVAVLRQENSALKDYIAKLSALHQQATQSSQSSPSL